MDEENQTFIQTKIAKDSGDVAKVKSCEGSCTWCRLLLPEKVTLHAAVSLYLDCRLRNQYVWQYILFLFIHSVHVFLMAHKADIFFALI